PLSLLYTLYPYTTLFRSYILQFPISTPYVLRQFIEVIHKYTNAKIDLFIHDLPALQLSMEDKERELVLFNQVDNLIVHNQAMKRSEEHTSELQSRFDLVC